MKVGIDISQIAFPGTGVAVYTKNLVENLLKLGPAEDYVLFAASVRQRKHFRVFPGVKSFVLPPTLLEFLWNQRHTLPVEKLIGPMDIFHSSDWTQPPSLAKKVTTIHDLLVYKYPEVSHATSEFRWRALAPSPNIVAAQKRRLEWVKKEADQIIAVSQSTKRDIIELMKIPEKKIRVIYEASTIKLNKQSKYHFDKPYILAVGTREPRKNLDRLVEAYRKLKTKDVELVIAGKYGWGLDDLPGIKLLGFVPQDEIAGLYSNAALFAFPSLYEGFGIPVLEAFNCDCPVVTSNVSSLPEVGGQAALYVDPLNVDDIAEKLDWVLTLGSQNRDALIRKGREQAKKFSWEKAAQETRKVYEELA